MPYDWDTFLDRSHSRPESLNTTERKALLTKTPVLTWSAKLPATTDYKERTERIPAPLTLKPGFYFIIASHDPEFGEPNNQVSYTDIWVSDLALVVRTRDGRIEGFVLGADSGEPLKGAEIGAWFLDRNGNRIAVPKTETDANGFFGFEPSERRGYLIRARHHGQEVATQNEFAAYPQQEPKARDQTVFFTDRALYRPGQTIHYQGIVLRVDQAKDNYEVLAGRRITVVFSDTNGKEIAKAEHQANDYGSFSGSFTAPRDRLMGRMQIRVTSGERGNAWFNVEEYKRPKFRVTLDAPKTAAKLNTKVLIPAKAEAYTGAAVDGAEVKYRVVREVRWPAWWGWWSWRRPQAQGSQEIAHGSTTTAADGTFSIEFVAKPDPKVDPKSEATFTFSVHADVTDSAGETRSDQRTVNVGFVALKAALSVDDWQTENQPVEVKIRTTTLDGEPQSAEGSLKVYHLQAPERVHRPPLSRNYWPLDEDSDGQPDADMSNPNHWELDTVAVEKRFTTDAEGRAALQFQLEAAAYRVVLETQDRFGKKVTAPLPLQVLRPDAAKLNLKIPHLLAAPRWRLEPGEEFTALWGTGYPAGRAFVEFEHDNQIIERYWTQSGRTQQQIKHAVSEAMRGGFTLHVTQVRDNRAFLDSRHIDVPWSNKELDLKWEHFVSKLQPDQKETWTAVITRLVGKKAVGARAPAGDGGKRGSEGPAKPGADNGKEATTEPTDALPPEGGTPNVKVVAEMVATLYDESLDQFMAFNWPHQLNVFGHDYTTANTRFVNQQQTLRHLQGNWDLGYMSVELIYRHFPQDIVGSFWSNYGTRRFRGMAVYDMNAVGLAEAAVPATATPPPAEAKMDFADGVETATRNFAFKAAGLGLGEGGAAAGEAPAQSPDLSQVTARKNLNETAFFYPQLLADSNGVVRMTFTMPEALTTWRFMGFAHDRQLRSGFLEDHAVTSKDLMVQPNPPRFLREGDEIEFTVKVSNQSPARQEGKVRLTFNYARNDQPADQDLANTDNEKSFDIPSKESRSYAWRIKVPDGCGFLTYKAVGSTGRISDGEEGYLPVLSRQILVTESMTLPIRGPATKQFKFTRLLESGQSKTLRNESLLVQMVSNPAWYAVMALPYLMEFPHECTEQTFNRFYANALARNIANSDPKIRRIFDQWKNTPALESPLEKNQDLKSVMLEETPWLRQAVNESQARKNVGILFDDNRLNYET